MNYSGVFPPYRVATQPLILIVPSMTTPGQGSAMPTVEASASVYVLPAGSAFVTTPLAPAPDVNNEDARDEQLVLPTGTASVSAGLFREFS